MDAEKKIIGRKKKKEATGDAEVYNQPSGRKEQTNKRITRARYYKKEKGGK